jgi:uncharacterized protein (DUF2141 family)
MRTLSILSSLLMLGSLPAMADEIQVQVKNIKSTEGEIGCALFSKDANFPDSASGDKVLWLKPQGDTLECRFSDLAPGTYAVSVLHDLNGNKEMDSNFIGAPTEDVGVSNNVRPSFRAPTFDEANFELAGTKALSVEIDH